MKTILILVIIGLLANSWNDSNQICSLKNKIIELTFDISKISDLKNSISLKDREISKLNAQLSELQIKSKIDVRQISKNSIPSPIADNQKSTDQPKIIVENSNSERISELSEQLKKLENETYEQEIKMTFEQELHRIYPEGYQEKIDEAEQLRKQIDVLKGE